MDHLVSNVLCEANIGPKYIVDVLSKGIDDMKTNMLFISFWNICLDNLPKGKFVRRSMTAAAARAAINKARKNKSLLCVSEDDLIAPYHKLQRDRHDDLCRVLSGEIRNQNFAGRFLRPF